MCNKQIEKKKNKIRFSPRRCIVKSRYKLMDRHFWLADGEKLPQNFVFYTENFVHSFASENYRSWLQWKNMYGEVYRVKNASDFQFQFRNRAKMFFFWQDLCIVYVMRCGWIRYVRKNTRAPDMISSLTFMQKYIRWMNIYYKNLLCVVWCMHVCVLLCATNRTEAFMRISRK